MPAPNGQPHSLAAIARATELSEQSLHYLLEGRTEFPRLNTARRLCRFYDISLDYFGCETEADCRAYLAQLASQRASPLVREINQTAETLTPSAKRRALGYWSDSAIAEVQTRTNGKISSTGTVPTTAPSSTCVTV